LDTKLTCPDCGGALGPAEPGVAPCTCFQSRTLAEDEASFNNAEQHGADTLNDTQHVETLSKSCFKCGANVAGKKRYKDSRGYMCADCNKAEIAAEKAGTTKCPECGRRLKETGLVEFRGQRMCKFCMNELRDADKKKIKVISGKNYDNQDRKTLKILIVIMILLALVIVYSHFRPGS
jgi:DNA-directed RNA polymerase subunit RPC12/RpoP